MIKTICKVTVLVFPLLFASCIKEGFDAENCPGEYTITPYQPSLWSPENNEIPNAMVTIIDSDGNRQTIMAGSNQPIDLDEGTYTVIATENIDKDKVTVDGTSISIATNPNGTAMDVPENTSGGYTEITIGGAGNGAPENTNFDVPTHVQSRPLVIKLKFEGENIALIESIAGKVEGIALERDLNCGFAPIDGQDRHPAIRTGSIDYAFDAEETAGCYSDSRRLLGISGNEEQILTFTVTYAGGVQKAYRYTITEAMNGFHTQDVLTPWVIEITLRLGADFTADIEDWKSGPESWMDAH